MAHLSVQFLTFILLHCTRVASDTSQFSSVFSYWYSRSRIMIQLSFRSEFSSFYTMPTQNSTLLSSVLSFILLHCAHAAWYPSQFGSVIHYHALCSLRMLYFSVQLCYIMFQQLGTLISSALFLILVHYTNLARNTTVPVLSLILLLIFLHSYILSTQHVILLSSVLIFILIHRAHLSITHFSVVIHSEHDTLFVSVLSFLLLRSTFEAWYISHFSLLYTGSSDTLCSCYIIQFSVVIHYWQYSYCMITLNSVLIFTSIHYSMLSLHGTLLHSVFFIHFATHCSV
jgi:hypothetical protein